ncbi:Ig-like domain-containing protein [Flavobacterium magnum]|nr:Ig-like domain-containing protein [Flavobacterium magnum]
MKKHYLFLSLLSFCGLLSFAQPTAVNDNITVTEDSDIFAQVVSNDNFGPAGPHETNPLAVVQFPNHGTAMANTDDAQSLYIEYAPDMDFNGSDTFTYLIRDANGLTATATVTVTVIDDGTDVPVAADDFAVTQQGSPISIVVMTNDNTGSDALGSYITVTGTTLMGGTVTTDSAPDPISSAIDDTILYTPPANYNGEDSFTYTLHDGNGDTSTATVTVIVTPDTTPLIVPLAQDDFATTVEEMSVTIAVLVNDSFGSDGPGTVPVLTNPAFPDMTPMGGIISVNDNGTPDSSDDTITYQPNLDITGTDTFTYTITDSNGDTSTATVTVYINAEAGPPVAVDDAITTSINTPVEINALENDMGVAGGPFYDISIWVNPTHGIAEINENSSPSATDNTIIYTPESGFIGQDTFEYRIFGSNGVDYATVTVTVTNSGILLKAFFDVNGNGTQDSEEADFNLGQFHYEINNNGIAYDAASSTGSFYINETNLSNTYDLSYTVNSNLTAYYTVSTSYQDVTAASSWLSEFKFAVTGSSFADVGVQLVPTSAPRPGFLYTNTIIYHNNAAQTASGTVTFNHGTAVSVNSVSQAGITNTANGFTFDFTNLAPFETRFIYVTMQVPAIPDIALGDLVINTVSVSAAGDDVMANDTSAVTQAVVGSYDPNDITEAHGRKIVHAEFTSDDYLTYTIRFENTGTANAENIRVENTLDAQLDEDTIEMVDASDNYTMERAGSNLVWDFVDVQLPPSEENTQIGHGYIVYRIKPKPGYAIGDIIANTAEIYFDFNPAITTNTFETEFTAPLSVDGIEGNTFSLYPNPVKDKLNINSRQNIQTLTVYNLLGQPVLEKRIDAVSGTLDTSGLEGGVYLVRVISAEAEKTIRIIKN